MSFRLIKLYHIRYHFARPFFHCHKHRRWRIHLSEVIEMLKQWLRRTAALLLSAVTLVTVAAAEQDPAPERHTVTWLLQWALGDCLPRGTLSLPAMLALYQSPALLSAQPQVLAYMTEQQAEAPAPQEQTASPSPAAPAVRQTAPRAALAFQDNGVPSQTVLIRNTAGYTVVRGVCVKNASNKTLDAAALAAEGFAARLTDSAPQVLILHTHGSEAYIMPAGQEYVSTGTCRTSDTTKNVVRVGDEIASVLSDYGISVLHDRTLYDDPLYEGAYGRSVEGIEAYLEKYPSISFILDIHRDAVEDAQHRQYKLVSQEDPNAAQISFVMGSNHDGWQENLKLAIAISESITAEHPTVMRPITLRNSNYNQHKSLGSMLVEVGAAGNSLDEALNSARIFADSFASVLLTTKA